MKVRNWKRKAMATIAAGGAIVVAGPGLANADVVLDFITGRDNGGGMPAGYGSNLAGAPNVSLLFDNRWDSFDNGWDGRGEVGQTDYPGTGGVGNEVTVSFIPDAGFGVHVTSFDLDEFVGGGDSVVDWLLLGTSFSGTWNDFNTANDAADAGGRSTVVTGMLATDAVFTSLTLQLTLISDGLNTSYHAMDNLAFGQVSAVPEPSSLAVIGIGLGAMLMRRKRNA